MRKVAAILLAAGESRRMGRPKQLLRLGGESLVRRAARVALASGCQPLIVVTGAEAERVGAELADLDVRLAHNPGWASGLGTSIGAGVRAARESVPDLDGLLVLLADQPRVTRDTLKRLLEAFERPGIERVCCAYAGSRGVPAVFGASCFAQLGSLEGDRGAKGLLRDEGGDLVAIETDEPSTDVDTPEDFAQLAQPLPPEFKSFVAEQRRSFIVTLRRDGSPTAHPMTALTEGDALLFNTYRKSVKTRNIQRDPRVCVVYLDGYEAETPRGFSVEGSATIREANRMPGAGSAAGPVSEKVAKRATDRLQSGKRILIHVAPERIRPLEGS